METNPSSPVVSLAALLSLSSDLTKVSDKSGLQNVLQKHLCDRFGISSYVILVKQENEGYYTYFITNISALFSGSGSLEVSEKLQKLLTQSHNCFQPDAADPTIIRLNTTLSENDTGKNNSRYTSYDNSNSFQLTELRSGLEELGLLWTNSEEISLTLLKGIADQISMAMAYLLSVEKTKRQIKEIDGYKFQLEQESLYNSLQDTTELLYPELVGSGPAMRRVCNLIAGVAKTNSTVLISGETGTGKELIAKAIHKASSQRNNIMVKVNCAAIPSNLIESEFFGHEKGSFTGSSGRRIGKFELAHNGTLFLDEIGEMPLELQVKVLRAIQEREIERVGGNESISVNVRIIAATNRNLDIQVRNGDFRADLYYRLNVFPIVAPPLRDRIDDLPQLVSHFLEKVAKSTGKNKLAMSRKVMVEMMNYHWPGNVRELEHAIERSVILTTKSTITSVLFPMKVLENQSTFTGQTKRLDEIERDYIIEILKKCKGKVRGAGGAAEVLCIPPTTLHSKMKRLGVHKKHEKKK